MLRYVEDLDRILRGKAILPGALQKNDLKIPLGGSLLTILLMAVLYGICMGFFAGFREDGSCFMQWLAGAVKVPALFFLTLAVTFPSLYVFTALVDSRLRFVPLMQLIVVSLVVNVTVLASLGPIVAFFSVSTTSYAFMLFFNMLVFAIAGVWGFVFMLQMLSRLGTAKNESMTPAEQSDESLNNDPSQAGQKHENTEPPVLVETHVVEEGFGLRKAKDRGGESNVNGILVFWMMVFGLVFAQMAWVLRPILGDPSKPFQWFCEREPNSFQAVLDFLSALLS